MKIAIGNLIGITLNLYIVFGSIVIFTILILPTQELGISLDLFMSSLINFISVIILCVQFFCLVPDLQGNAFSFPPLRIMFAVGLSYMAFTKLR